MLESEGFAAKTSVDAPYDEGSVPNAASVSVAASPRVISNNNSSATAVPVHMASSKQFIDPLATEITSSVITVEVEAPLRQEPYLQHQNSERASEGLSKPAASDPNALDSSVPQSATANLKPANRNASILSAFICRRAPKAEVSVLKKREDLEIGEDCGGEKDVGSNNGEEDSDEASPDSAKEFLDHWSHFRPLKTMRRGCPYHMLSVKEKLQILEYLVDELLAMEEFSAEFSRRHELTARFPYPYGPLPSKEEMENLENEDECGICGKEGDLLCCDGCEQSYHKKCLGLGIRDGVDPGTWFCTECDLKDPACFGPLRVGRKSALDWFSLTDLDEATKASGGTHADHREITGKALAETFQKASCVANKLIVVHGFVFEWNSSRDVNASQLLDSTALQTMLKAIGPAYCTRWPLSQVPLDASKLFENPLVTNKSFFFQSAERYDPCVYNSMYRMAPHPSIFRKVKDAHFLDYETRCAAVPTAGMSLALNFVMTNDRALAENLRSSKLLFDPYKAITAFLLKLEAHLLKASLLGEFWKADRTSEENDSWSGKVQGCASVRRLSLLLIELLDDIHPVAFLSGWFDRVSAKIESVSINKRSAKSAVIIPANFNASDESLRRHWEHAPMSAIPQLIAKSSASVRDWIRVTRPDLASGNVRKGKRKHCGGKFDQTRWQKDAKVALTGSIEPKRYEQNGNSDDLQGGGGGGEALDAASKSTPIEILARVCPRVIAQARERLLDFETELSMHGLPKKSIWPVAGRKLFDPPGTLPKPVVRYLARNGGGVAAPFVTYSSLYEVGQVSFCHIFRKRVMMCHSYEEFVVLLRTLEAFLDHEVSLHWISASDSDPLMARN